MAHLGLAVEDLWDDAFNPPRPRPPGTIRSPVRTHHPGLGSRSAAGLHAVPVRVREVVLRHGPYELELAKHARTDGDALVHRAIVGTLHPERPASTWQLINDVPPFTNAKQAKKGGPTIRCPCECEVCKQNPLFSISLRKKDDRQIPRI